MYYSEMIDNALSSRRKALSMMKDNSLMIVSAHPERYQSRDCEYSFRQNSYFLYLSALNEPDGVLVLKKTEGKEEAILFVHDFDMQHLIWQGRRIKPDEVQNLKIESADILTNLSSRMPELMKSAENIYFPFLDSSIRYRVIDWVDTLSKTARNHQIPTNYSDACEILDSMRLIKNEQEINLLSKACSISASGHSYIMERIQSGIYEYQIEADILREYRNLGADGGSFLPIVAAGENACILHYKDNKSEIKDGQMVLIDSGAAYKCYAGDITRTIPIGKNISSNQQAIYELVLAVQEEIISIAKPGSSFDILNKKAIELITQGAVDLGILKGNVSSLIEQEAHKAIYMHGIGHWLGMDVHDVGAYKDRQGNPTQFLPGMAITVEPGIYISDMNPHIDKKWHGIGIRIEDDVLITDNGNKVLTSDAPKKLNEVMSLKKG